MTPPWRSISTAALSHNAGAGFVRTRRGSSSIVGTLRTITSGLQLFGNVTFWLFWENGYDALRALDDNGDRRMTGAELSGMSLWHDRNSDGRSDRDEVRPVGEWGIVALSCGYEYDPRHPNEIAFSRRGVTFANGATRPTFDLVLTPAPAGR